MGTQVDLSDPTARRRRLDQLTANLRRLKAPSTRNGFAEWDAWWAAMVAPKLDEYRALQRANPVIDIDERRAERDTRIWFRQNRPDLQGGTPPDPHEHPHHVARPPVLPTRAPRRAVARPRERRPSRRQRAVARAGPDDPGGDGESDLDQRQGAAP